MTDRPSDSFTELPALDFIIELEKLKTVSRQNATLDGRAESSAEHSWHLALMADSLLRDVPGLDRRRVTLMVLLHDIVEIDAGDNFLFDRKAEREIAAKESAAAKRIFGMLPPGICGEYRALWEEFEAMVTPEARYARALDALQPLVGHYHTAPEGFNPHRLTRSMIMEKKRFIEGIDTRFWKVALRYMDACCDRGLFIDE